MTLSCQKYVSVVIASISSSNVNTRILKTRIEKCRLAQCQLELGIKVNELILNNKRADATSYLSFK